MPPIAVVAGLRPARRAAPSTNHAAIDARNKYRNTPSHYHPMKYQVLVSGVSYLWEM